MKPITRIGRATIGAVSFRYSYDEPQRVAHPVLDSGSSYTEREFWSSQLPDIGEYIRGLRRERAESLPSETAPGSREPNNRI